VILEVSGVAKALGDRLLCHEGGYRWLLPTDPKLGKVERATAQTPKVERGRLSA
jgi:hypothetical protein